MGTGRARLTAAQLVLYTQSPRRGQRRRAGPASRAGRPSSRPRHRRSRNRAGHARARPPRRISGRAGRPPCTRSHVRVRRTAAVPVQGDYSNTGTASPRHIGSLAQPCGFYGWARRSALIGACRREWNPAPLYICSVPRISHACTQRQAVRSNSRWPGGTGACSLSARVYGALVKLRDDEKVCACASPE